MVYHLLKGLINERGSRAGLAKALGISVRSLDNRLNGETDWRLCDVQATIDYLNIPADQIDYFFKITDNVLKGNKECTS